VLRIRRYERLSTENRRFRSNRAQNFMSKGSSPPIILLARKVGWTRFHVVYGHTFFSYHNARVWQTDGRTERPSQYRALHYTFKTPRKPSFQKKIRFGNPKELEWELPQNGRQRSAVLSCVWTILKLCSKLCHPDHDTRCLKLILCQSGLEKNLFFRRCF